MLANNEPSHDAPLPRVARQQARPSRPDALSGEEWYEALVKLLNDTLAGELLCLLRYMRHYFRLSGPSSPDQGRSFQMHVDRASAHAEQLAQRIVALGGEPEFWPGSLTLDSYATDDETVDLSALIRANLVAERLSIAQLGQVLLLIGDSDVNARTVAEGILADEHAHAEQLRQWLAR